MADEPTPEAVSAHPHLRLAWSRPAHLPPLPPRRPLNLAIAIERHLQGADGYTDEQFAFVFARPLSPADAAAPSTL